MSEAIVYRSVRYRLHPKTKRKHNQLAQCVGACRFVWNHFLDKNRKELEWHKAAPSFGMTAPKPNVRQKAGLNRGVLNTGWSNLRWMLGYKASKLVAVNPAHTSQTCHVCGVVDKSSRKTQSKFHCVHCGHEANADVNAALNILASGIGAAGRGGCGVGRPVMRQNSAWLPVQSRI